MTDRRSSKSWWAVWFSGFSMGVLIGVVLVITVSLAMPPRQTPLQGAVVDPRGVPLTTPED